MRKITGLQLTPDQSPLVLRELTNPDGPNSSISLSVRLRVSCDPNYFGPGCAKFCKSKDDGHGHTICSVTGDLMCAEGWTGPPKCNTRKLSFWNQIFILSTITLASAICKRGCDHGNCSQPGECRWVRWITIAMCTQTDRQQLWLAIGLIIMAIWAEAKKL